jgi:hypothetical protein
VPIAYTLVAAALLLAVVRRSWVIGVLAVSLFILLTTFAEDSFNLSFVALGMLGVAYGLLKARRGNGTAGRLMAITSILIAGIYFTLVTVLPEDTPWIYAAGVFGVVELFRSARLYLPLPQWGCYFFEEFGRYSLFAYIIQIFLLRTLLWAAGGLGVSGYATGPILICNLLLFLTIIAIARFRQLSPSFDGFYRAIFG